MSIFQVLPGVADGTSRKMECGKKYAIVKIRTDVIHLIG